MIRKVHANQWFIPASLLIVTTISFVPLIHSLGFYWDDWPSIWYLHFQGSESFHENFASDRPLFAWIFRLTTSLLGESTLAWQLFGIFTRWMTTLAFWWVLGLIWPNNKTQVAWTALLFAIYPSFRQQYIAVTYSNAFLVYLLFLISFATMVLAIKKHRLYWLWMIISVVSSGVSMFIAEYFFGLELLRPLLLWFLQKDQEMEVSKKIRKILLQWAPYLLLMILFMAWIVFLRESPRGEITLFDQLGKNPFTTVINLAKTILEDILKVSTLAWINTVNLQRFRMLARSNTPGLITNIVILIGVTFFTFWVVTRQPKIPNQYKENKAGSNKNPWARQALIAGAAALLIGGWPFWATNLNMDLFFPNDRFTLPMMIGASLLIAGLVSLLPRPHYQGAVVIALLVGLASGMHYQDAILYQTEWRILKAWFWQLSWRVPQIEPGTIIMSGDLYLDYYSDNSLSAPLNWTYAPDNHTLDMPYLFMDVEARLGNDLTSLEPDMSVSSTYRAAAFEGNTSQALLVFFAPPRCVKVMNPVYDLNLPYKPDYIRDALDLSNPDLIIADPQIPATPPKHIFGEEPDPGWCYYFEKADLAAQMGDWDEITNMAETAFRFKDEFDRETASELIPFIQAYAHTDQWETAYSLSMTAYQASPKMENMLCSIWYYLTQSTPESISRKDALNQINAQLGCNILE